MNKAVLLILTGSIALLGNGCSWYSDFTDAKKELEENVVKPTPVQVNASQQNNQQEEEEFADLEEEVEPLQEIAGLIPATNPEVRVRSSVRGRNDPFAVVTLNPLIEVDQKEEKKPETNITSRFSGSQNQSNSDDDELNLPEPILEPSLAQEVIISGLYEANGSTKLIVQAPEEDTSRYVEVGQYLSNGQVLVKRIEQDSFNFPLIILEESGIEVAKTIGISAEDEADDVSFVPSTIPNSTLSSSISLNSN
ncbi:MAG: hypothetical protein AAF298_01260 [Cyanobacteria bacterium P01_A01_bin.40]